MIITQNKIKEVEEVSDILCDICGTSTKVAEYADYEYAYLAADFGYGTSYDMEAHRCHICIKCYLKIKRFIEDLGGKILIENIG